MRRTTRFRLIGTGLLLAGTLACASGGLRLGGLTADQVYALALEKIEEREWDDAIAVLETFVFQFPTHPQYQDARFRLGQVHFEKREFITAAAEFARLADDYPGGPFADQARFRVCESYARLSPKPQLDQEYTRFAIDHCESLLAYYPDSEHAERAREIVAEMRHKLAQKLYLVGEHYYRRQAWHSAILAYNDVMQSYAATAVAPRALLRLVQSYENLGYEEEAQEHRERLLREFPDSAEARQIGNTDRPVER
jgi:outer membrane protein assembly factor BamD